MLQMLYQEKFSELAPSLKEKGIDILYNYDNKREDRQIKIIDLP